MSQRFNLAPYSIQLHYSFTTAETAWRKFEQTAVFTAYQRFDFLSSWFEHIGSKTNTHPVIAIATEQSSDIAFIWPFVLSSSHKTDILKWQGGKHSNYNFGLYNKQTLESLSSDNASRLLKAIMRHAGADAALLLNQPQEWNGFANPLVNISSSISPNPVFSTSLRDCTLEDILKRQRSAKARKRLRWQHRKLENLGKLEAVRADTVEQALDIMESFFRQKCERMLAQGKIHPFADTDVQLFLRQIATLSPSADNPLLELHALKLDDAIIAVYAGVIACGCFSTMFNSFETQSEASRYSPAEILVQSVINSLIERGIDEFDLGTGAAHYKTHWCEREDTLKNTFVSDNIKGLAYSSLFRTALRLERSLKTKPKLLALTHSARQLLINDRSI